MSASPRASGIVNGTTNYVLTRMTEDGSSFAEAVAEAQELGYAERDPTADVEGFDAAAKAAIIASIAFRARVVAPATCTAKASRTSPPTTSPARTALGYVVKLLAVAEEGRDGGEVGVRVHPAMVPRRSPAARRRLLQRGVHRGRGGRPADAARPGRGRRSPTASAVLGDLIDAAKNLHAGGSRAATIGTLRATADPADRRDLLAVLRQLDVADRPGVLAKIAQRVRRRTTCRSRSMQQKGAGGEWTRRARIVTHLRAKPRCPPRFDDVRELDVVARSARVLRVVGGEEDDRPLARA